jgi:hypothetical protein
MEKPSFRRKIALLTACGLGVLACSDDSPETPDRASTLNEAHYSVEETEGRKYSCIVFEESDGGGIDCSPLEKGSSVALAPNEEITASTEIIDSRMFDCFAVIQNDTNVIDCNLVMS